MLLGAENGIVPEHVMKNLGTLSMFQSVEITLKCFKYFKCFKYYFKKIA